MGMPEARYPGRAPIDSYGPAGFRFAGMSHKGSILCLTTAIVAWPPTDATLLRPEDFAAVLAERDDVDFVLLGTGSRHIVPPAAVSDAFRAAGLSFDVMATGPAARTFNIVLAEGRRAVAALLLAC